jgi:hypothetical protein
LSTVAGASPAEPYAGGIDIDTGAPRGLASAADLVAEALSDAARDDLARHADWIERATRAPFDVMAGVDPLDLAQAGWGVIFAQGADPRVRKALQPLLDQRRAQAGERYREYTGRRGYRPGDDKWSWLERQGVGPGPVDPRQVPYYLLIVGAPAQIPFAFQCQLDVQYAVGRLAFDTPAEYRRYAEAVVATEQGRAARPRRVAVFGPRNGDPMAALAHDRLSKPLAAALGAERGWDVEPALGAAARRARLAALLGDEAPALLVTVGHGVFVGPGDERQARLQGALVCHDWPGHGGPRPEHYFAADDLSDAADLRGMVVFSLACFSAGTPRFDTFPGVHATAREEIAPQDFVAALPKRLLAHPGGPALAVVGHVDSAYEHGFKWLERGDQSQTYVSALRLMMGGAPVGRALEGFSQRYAELGCDLADMLEGLRLGNPPDEARLARLWQGSRDARGYVLLGDPAVRVGAEAAALAAA